MDKEESIERDRWMVSIGTWIPSRPLSKSHRGLWPLLSIRLRMATRGRFSRHARVLHVSETSLSQEQGFFIVWIAWNRIVLTRCHLRSPRKPVVNVPPLVGTTNVSDRMISRVSHFGMLLVFLRNVSCRLWILSMALFSESTCTTLSWCRKSS